MRLDIPRRLRLINNSSMRLASVILILLALSGLSTGDDVRFLILRSVGPRRQTGKRQKEQYDKDRLAMKRLRKKEQVVFVTHDYSWLSV